MGVSGDSAAGRPERIAGEQQVLAGGMMKSGAAEALRAEKWRVAL